ncbi:MAG: chromate transporter, partial [Chthoniobacterales bacterium]
MNGKAGLPSPETPSTLDEPSAAPPPSFAEAFRFWLRLGFISFGGPAGQIAIMQTELVEKRRWISQARFLHALNFCMMLPGPEAQQLAIYLGWLLHRGRGGLVAGVLFVLPSMFILWALSLAYVTYGHLPLVTSLFHGLQSAVLAIVALALLRIARKALPNWAMLSIALLAFLCLFGFGLPFPFLVLSALLLGYVGGALWPHLFVSQNKAAHAGSSGSEFRESDSSQPIRPTWRRALRIALIGFTIWWLPILCAGLWQGWSSALYQEGLFFSKAAVVTFGGAYAVLPYVAQQAVETYGW